MTRLVMVEGNNSLFTTERTLVVCDVQLVLSFSIGALGNDSRLLKGIK